MHDDAATYEHDEVIQLLPFFATGALRGTQRAGVERHLQVCITCRRELANEKLTHQAFRRVEPADNMASLAYARLSAQLAGPAGTPPDVPARRRRPEPWIASALAASLLALVAGGLLEFRSEETRDPVFRTLAREEAVAYRARGDARVVLQAALSRARARELLAGAGFDVLGGPDALGVYVVRLSAPSGRSLEDALASVRALPEVRAAYLHEARRTPGGDAR